MHVRRPCARHQGGACGPTELDVVGGDTLRPGLDQPRRQERAGFAETDQRDAERRRLAHCAATATESLAAPAQTARGTRILPSNRRRAVRSSAARTTSPFFISSCTVHSPVGCSTGRILVSPSGPSARSLPTAPGMTQAVATETA